MAAPIDVDDVGFDAQLTRALRRLRTGGRYFDAPGYQSQALVIELLESVRARDLTPLFATLDAHERRAYHATFDFQQHHAQQRAASAQRRAAALALLPDDDAALDALPNAALHTMCVAMRVHPRPPRKADMLAAVRQYRDDPDVLAAYAHSEYSLY
jgi:hypothetical protein